MPVCPQCKQELPDDTAICPNCGQKIATSGPPISKGQTSAKGRVIEILLVVAILGILYAILRPVFLKAGYHARASVCQSSIRVLSRAIVEYAYDWNERLPPASSWSDLTEPRVNNDQFYVCPEDLSARCAYAMPSELSLRELRSLPTPHESVVLYESDLGWNGSSYAPWPYAFRHEGGVWIGFADGSGRMFRQKTAPRGLPTPSATAVGEEFVSEEPEEREELEQDAAEY